MLHSSKLGDLVFLNIHKDPFVISNIDRNYIYPIEIVNINNNEEKYHVKFNGEFEDSLRYVNIKYTIKVEFSLHENTGEMYIDRKYFEPGYYLDHLFRTKRYNEYKNGLILFCGNKTITLNNKMRKLYNSLGKKDF